LENLDCTIDLGNVKPYLRPLESQTDEEMEERNDCVGDVMRMDYYYSHHLDCHQLIKKGLALEAPEGMYGKWTSLRGNLKEDTQGNIVGGLKL
jgi:hypothetical protein